MYSNAPFYLYAKPQHVRLLVIAIIKKAREFQKNIYSALLTMPKPLTAWITINCGKF